MAFYGIYGFIILGFTRVTSLTKPNINVRISKYYMLRNVDVICSEMLRFY